MTSLSVVKTVDGMNGPQEHRGETMAKSQRKPGTKTAAEPRTTAARTAKRAAALLLKHGLERAGAQAAATPGGRRLLRTIVPEYREYGRNQVLTAINATLPGLKLSPSSLRDGTTVAGLLQTLTKLLGTWRFGVPPAVWKCANGDVTMEYGDGTCQRDGLPLKPLV